MITDEDLLRSFVRDRSRTAFEEILRRHGGLVFGVCRRSLGDRQEAEDATQSVFLIFLEKAPRLGRGTVLSAWLYRTAVFVSRNQFRARIRRESRLPEPASPVGPPAWEEAKPHLDDALARLPQRLQDALVVHYLQGKTLAQTAAALDCPVKTLEKRVGRGLERLRELLGSAGVAIGSAALVALLQQEARGASPARLVEDFRGRPISPACAPAPLTLLRTLVLPAAVALVAAGFIVGAWRMAAIVPESAVPTSAGAARRASGRSTPTGAAAVDLEAPGSPASGTIRFFPASFEEFAALYRKMAEFPESVERWAALGIDVRKEDLQAIPNLEEYDLSYSGQLIFDLFKAWAARDPRLAAEWLYRAYAVLPASEGWTPERPEDSRPGEVTLMEATLDLWFARDAAAVESWMKGLPAGLPRNQILVEYLLVAARQPGARFESLAALADSLGSCWGRQVAVYRVAEEWARHAPAAAAAWVLLLPPTQPLKIAEGPTFTLEQPRFPETLLLPFASQSEGGTFASSEFLKEGRLGALAQIARSWAASDLEAARRWSEALPEDDERRRAMDAVGELWAERDPRAALEYARAHPEASWYDSWLDHVATRLVASDRAAAEAVAQLASPESRVQILSRVLQRWTELHPQEVGIDILRTIFAVEGSSLKNVSGTVWELTRSWTTLEPRAAAGWAMGLEGGLIRDIVLRAVGSTWAETDPRAALDWAAGVPESIRGQIHASVAGALATKDRDLALQVASGLRQVDGKIQVLSDIGEGWAKQAPDLALAWAKSWNPIEERDHCLLGVLGGLAERDAEQARREVASIVDDQVKTIALEAIEVHRRVAERKALRKSLLRREEGKQSP